MKLFRKMLGQREVPKNRQAFDCLIELGFPRRNVRKALLDLNGIKMKRFVSDRVSANAVYATLQGLRRNPVVMELVARELGLPVEDLF